ncbi:MAG: hypothetical protein CMJ20_11985 [Phycisphaeraceae bacterium]|nr:hypothetical protein [Phycisphaeraceae bacterium]
MGGINQKIIVLASHWWNQSLGCWGEFCGWVMHEDCKHRSIMDIPAVICNEGFGLVALDGIHAAYGKCENRR